MLEHLHGASTAVRVFALDPGQGQSLESEVEAKLVAWTRSVSKPVAWTHSAESSSNSNPYFVGRDHTVSLLLLRKK